MRLPKFLSALFEHGHVGVTSIADPFTKVDQEAASEVLRAAELTRRLEFPGDPPPWNNAVGLWAAESFYAACQLAVDRRVDESAGMKMLARGCPPATAAEQHYSVDLVFQYLPDLYKLARGAAPDDPLLRKLDEWALAWPLSSVGMPNNTEPDIEPILNHLSLLLCYADRIVLRRDVSRLSNSRVREAVRAQLGMHVELAPQFAEALSVE